MRSPRGANTFTAVPGATTSPAIDSSVSASTSYDYQVTASDGVNAPVSSNLLTLVILNPAPATGFTIAGPTSGIVGQLSLPFTITPNGSYTGTITVTPSGGGLSAPIVLTFTNSAKPQTFTLRPLLAGIVTLTSTNSGTLTTPSAWSYRASTTATLYQWTGPSSGIEHVASTAFTVTPNGPYTGTITITPAGGGLTTPIVLTFAASATPQTFTITPTAPGTVTLTSTNSGGLADPAAIGYDSSPVVPIVLGSGEGLRLGFLDNSGNPATVTSLASTNDIQTIAIAAHTAAPVPLTFNGQTTGAIPINPAFPPGCIYWELPVTAGTSYTVALEYQNGYYKTNYFRVDLIDGITGSILGTSLANNSLDPATGTIYTTVFGGGITSYMKTIGTVTPTTTTLVVLITLEYAVNPATTNAILTVGSLTDVATSAVTTFGVHDTTLTVHNINFSPQAAPYYGGYQGYMSFLYNPQPFGVGGPYSSIAASDIQSALLALSSVQAGGLTVTDTGGAGFGPYAVDFIGPMAGVLQPLITTTNSGLTITHTNPGGSAVSMVVNGGSPVLFPPSKFVWHDMAPWPTRLDIPFPQQLAAPLDTLVNIDLTLQPDYNWVNATGGGYSGRAVKSSTNGDYTEFVCQPRMGDTYQVAMTWPTDATLSTTTQVIVMDNAFNVLATLTVNQSVAPSDFTSGGVGWHILGVFTIAYPITGFFVKVVNTGGTICADAVRVTSTTTNNSIQIQPTDVVTVSWPAGLFTTTAGSVPAVTDLAVTNGVNQSSLPGVVGTPTMGIGYNITPDNTPYNTGFLYSSLHHRVAFNAAGLVTDSNGYPVSATAQSINTLVIQTAPLYPGIDPKGVPNAPNGLYTIEWDEGATPTDVQAGVYGGTITEVTGYQSLTGTTNNRRVYNFQPGPLVHTPQLYIQVISGGTPSGGVYPFSMTNLRIWPPDPSDPSGNTPWLANQPLFYPPTVAMIKAAGTTVSRFMDWLSTNGNSIANYTDFLPSTALAIPTRTATLSVATITNPASSFWNPASTCPIEVTTTTPHGLVDLIQVNLITTGTMTFGTQTYGPSTYTCIVKVISPTVFQAAIVYAGYGLLASTITGGTVTVTYTSNGCIDDIFYFCNAVGSNCHLNIPPSLSDAGVTSMVNRALTLLNPGLKLKIEYGNEPWNDHFQATWFFRSESILLYGSAPSAYDPTPSLVRRSAHVHSLAITAATALGRSGDIIRCMNSFYASGAALFTANICTVASAIGATFEEILIAPYVDNQPFGAAEPNFQQFFDTATGRQCVDNFERVTADGLFVVQIAAHRNALNSAGLTGVKLTGYEGGLNEIMPGLSTIDLNLRTAGMLAEPRMFQVMTALLQGFQDGGMSEIAIYYFSGAGDIFRYGSNPTGWHQFDWSTYYTYNQPNGTGSYTTDATSFANPRDLSLSKSQAGGAIAKWNALRTVRTNQFRLKNYRTTSSKTSVHGS